MFEKYFEVEAQAFPQSDEKRFRIYMANNGLYSSCILRLKLMGEFVILSEFLWSYMFISAPLESLDIDVQHLFWILATLEYSTSHYWLKREGFDTLFTCFFHYNKKHLELDVNFLFEMKWHCVQYCWRVDKLNYGWIQVQLFT